MSLLRRRFDDAGEDGMTLIEVLIAVFILAVAIVALASVASASLMSVRVARDRDLATSAASAALERARGLGFANLAHSTGDTALAGARFVSTETDVGSDVDDDGDVDGTLVFDHTGEGDWEPLDIHSDGGVDPHVCPPGTDPAGCWGVSFEGDITVRTFVTTYTEGGEEARRVTAHVTWTDRGGAERAVRESTVVARARRGLPVPNFDIDGEKDLTVAAHHPPGTSQVCFDHTFRNLGARDSYDVWVTTPDGSPDAVTTTRIDSTTLRAAVSGGATWRVGAWLGFGPDSDGDGSPDYTARQGDLLASDPAPGVRMEDEPDGDFELESPFALANNAEVPLRVCFAPDSSDDVDDTLTVLFRSSFDESQTAAVTYRIVIDEFEFTYFLKDIDPSSHHDRPQADSAFDMLTAEEGGTPTYGGQTRNYDRNLDPDNRPGLFLSNRDDDPGDAANTVGVWDHEFEAPTVLGGNADLVLWSAHDDALGSGGGRTGKTLSYRFTLQHVDSNGSPENDNVGTALHEYEHPLTSAGFTDIVESILIGDTDGDGTIDADDTVSLGANEALRLVVTCTSAPPTATEPGDDCHVIHDHTSFPSSLTVRSPGTP